MTKTICFLLVLLAFVVVANLPAAEPEKETEVKVRDRCDPASFNSAIGPGTCTGERTGHITFDEFINELTQDQKVGSWRFNPEVIVTSKEQTTLSLESYAGETHTFTKVEEFGGGFVGALNILSGNPIPRPECLAAPSATNIFVPAGAEVAGPTLTKGETAKYQCCIHPWMRLTVKAPGGKN